jgi:hypothetical protein
MFLLRRLARFIEFIFSDQFEICLNSRIRELEGCVAQTIVQEEEEEAEGSQRFCHPFLDPICPSSMLCNMLVGDLD